MRYYRMLCAWHEHDDIEFNIIDSHAKTAQVRDTSSRETLRALMDSVSHRAQELGLTEERLQEILVEARAAAREE